MPLVSENISGTHDMQSICHKNCLEINCLKFVVKHKLVLDKGINCFIHVKKDEWHKVYPEWQSWLYHNIWR